MIKNNNYYLSFKDCIYPFLDKTTADGEFLDKKLILMKNFRIFTLPIKSLDTSPRLIMMT